MGIQDNLAVRWFWWAMAMIPFCYVVMTLVSGLNDATAKQPDSVRGLVVMARYLTVISWLTYPGVYIIKNMGLAGNIATTYEQVGYSIADVVAKAVFGVLIWAIAAGVIQGSAAFGPCAIFKVQPAERIEAALALGMGLARTVGRPILSERHWPVHNFQEL